MFRTFFFSPVSSFNDEKVRHKYYNKRITTRDNGNLQSHDQEASILIKLEKNLGFNFLVIFYITVGKNATIKKMFD